jgi:lipoprotein-anchoring transpeptidase ErfK/SrfK
VLPRQPYTIVIDRSARTLTVRRGAAAVRGFRVAVGAPGTVTPLGRAGVTDTLVYPTGSGPYGCCAVALTSRQTNLPPTWDGGAQIAIHGTADESVIGRAVSLGCVRGRNADLRWVIRNVPAGALVTVVR